MNFTNLHCHSYFSLLDGLSSPEQIAKRCADLGQTACALTDHGSVSGAVAFIKACRKYNIKPILGIEAYVTKSKADIKDKTNIVSHQIILAKNLKGWYNLIKLVSNSNDHENFYYKPRIDIDMMAKFCDDNMISFSGHLGSTIHHRINDIKYAENYIKIMKDIFGKDNFFLEVQLIDSKNNKEAVILADQVRNIANRTNTPCVATADCHYPTKEDSSYHQILLCSSIQTTLPEINRKRSNGEKIGLDSFFNSQQFYIPSGEDVVEAGNTPQESVNSCIIAEKCESYDITGPPRLPKFQWTQGMSENDYLRHLCREGWRKKYKEDWDKNVYGDRVKEELAVFEKANLAGYFLIVQDYVNWAKNQGWLIGPGRGCLSPDTHILTSNGIYKNIKDINIGDKVYTLDGNENVVQQKFIYDCNEELISINTFYGNYNDIKLTKDHKILVEKFQHVDNYENLSDNTKKSIKRYKEPVGNLIWIEAKDLKKNDWLVVPKLKTKDLEYQFDLKKYCDNIDTRYDENFVYYEPNNKLCKVKTFSKKMSRIIKLDNDFAKILGIFTGDGWINFSAKNKIGFAFNNDINSVKYKNIQFVINYFKNLGCEIGIYKSKNKKLTQIIILHKCIYHLFKDIFNDYNSSKTKHVPYFIFNCNKDIISSFLTGYLESDGYEDKNKIVFSTISIRLSNEIKALCLFLGIPSSISIENRIGQKNIKNISYVIRCPLNKIFGSRNSKIKYVYRDFENFILIKVKNVKTINNTCNKVYDIQIENQHNYLTSCGIVHNSVGGCLVAYLLNITNIDPIQYGLMFHRFYNEGRNTEDRVSLPDIDVDFPITKRKLVIDYLRQKYCAERVCQMATFGRLQGRGALKEVLRIYNACDFETMNKITAKIPQEHEIDDQLKETKETSILRWTLQNEPDILKDWCSLDENGNVVGDYGIYVERAIKIEGVYKSQGKHAAGVVISSEKLDDVCPMIHDKNSSEKIAGMSMEDLESMGHVKLDILGVAALDKLQAVNNLLRFGKIGD